MTTIFPTADTALAKARLTRDWHDSGAGRHADLTDWVQSTTPDGLPMMSARLSAPLCAEMWGVFAARQEVTVAQRSGAGDVLPALDYSAPGRTGCAWREGGVWVEVWHPNTPEAPAPRPGPPVVFRAPATNDLPGFGCTLTITAHPDQAELSTPSAPLPRRPANRFRRTPKEQ